MEINVLGIRFPYAECAQSTNLKFFYALASLFSVKLYNNSAIFHFDYFLHVYFDCFVYLDLLLTVIGGQCNLL